jgi:hypothetical protein
LRNNRIRVAGTTNQLLAEGAQISRNVSAGPTHRRAHKKITGTDG